MRFVSGEAYVVDDVYISAVWPISWHVEDGLVKITWRVWIKPLALDDVLWAAFLPDVEMGPRMRLTRRINGAFKIKPLQIAEGNLALPITDEPDSRWEALLAEFERVRADFIDRYPAIPDSLTAPSGA